jgi:hypothetical protein
VVSLLAACSAEVDAGTDDEEPLAETDDALVSGCAAVYFDSGFQNQIGTFLRPGTYSLTNSQFNDKISSVNVWGGCEVRVYEHGKGKGGRSRTFNKPASDLGDMNDAITELEVSRRDICEDSVYECYSSKHCSGNKVLPGGASGWNFYHGFHNAKNRGAKSCQARARGDRSQECGPCMNL